MNKVLTEPLKAIKIYDSMLEGVSLRSCDTLYYLFRSFASLYLCQSSCDG